MAPISPEAMSTMAALTPVSSQPRLESTMKMSMPSMRATRTSNTNCVRRTSCSFLLPCAENTLEDLRYLAQQQGDLLNLIAAERLLNRVEEFRTSENTQQAKFREFFFYVPR
jgi:hypothetical protein